MEEKKSGSNESRAPMQNNGIVKNQNEAGAADHPLFKQLFNSIPQASFLLDSSFKILDINPTAKVLLSSGKKSVWGSSIFDFVKFRSSGGTDIRSEVIHKEDGMVHTFGQLLCTGLNYSINFSRIDLDGSNHYYLQLEPVSRLLLDNADYDLRIEKGNGESVSVTSRQFIENQVNEKDDSFLHTIIDSLPHPFYVIEATTNKTIIKNTAATTFEESLALIHCFMKSDVVSCTGDPLSCALGLVNKTSTPVRIEHEFFTKAGEKLIHEVFGYPVFNSSGNLKYVIQYSIDVSERKKNEAELLEYQAVIDNLMTNLPGMAFRCLNEANWTMEYVSPGCRKLTGYSASELINNKKTHYGDLIFEDDRSRVWEKVQKAVKLHRVYRIEYRIITRNGRIKWVLEQGRGIFDKQERLVRLEGLVTDITDGKNAEIKLKRELAINQGLASVGLELLGESVKSSRVAYLVQKYLRALTGSTFSMLIAPATETDDSDFYCFDENDETENTRIVHHAGNPSNGSYKFINALISNRKPQIINELNISVGIPCLPPGEFNFNRIISVPAFIKNQYAGIIILADAEHDYTEETIEVVQRYINMYALAVFRIKAEESLQLAKEKAEDSDRLKSLFLSNMSHEIRTPMNAILGFAEMLQDPELQIEEKDRFLDVIIKSGDNLLRLINDIIDISKIEAGQLRIIYSDCRLNELFAEMESFFNKELIRQRKEHLTFYVQTGNQEPDFSVYTDTVRIRQIITNLVGNAIKFTDEGFIELGYRIRGEKIEFYIRDSGIGIPVDQQNHIFERFGQVKEVAARNLSGTGLGLTITKNLVELLGGRIWLDSYPAEGSTFWFSIPYKTGYHGTGQLFESESSQTISIDLAGKCILVVEDVDTNYFYISSLLEKLGCRVIRATDGLKAVEICKTDDSVNLVLMDIELPVMDGYTATAEIKKFKPELPVVAQTAFAMMGEREKCIEAGCNDYIAKPIRKEILLETIARYL